jgi:hypothetical protein
MKCGKRSCPCHTDPDVRHGPYRALTRTVDGKTENRYVGETEAPLIEAQVAARRAFRAWADGLVECCERWADAELDALGAPARETPKKGGSKRRS